MNPAAGETAYPSRVPAAEAPEDQALMGRIAERDETALAELYDRWVGPVYSLIVHLLKDADEAEDVVEETFWQVWQRASAYDAARGTVRTWLLTIARSRALDRARARGRIREESNSDFRAAVDESPDPAADAESAERRVIVSAAMNQLPEEQRRALELAYFGGMSQSEIAESLGQPLGTIKTRMRLGMSKLRDTLAVLSERTA